MAVSRIDLKGQSISMDGETADRLIRLGSGDAALLYLYLLRRQGSYDPVEAAHALGWTGPQLESALAQLRQLGLAGGTEATAPSPSEPVPTPDQAPEYTADDLAVELSDRRSPFAALLDEVERALGRKLPNSQVLILLELYDYAGIPAEVLLVLVHWLQARYQRKYGPGKRLSMKYVRQVAYQWKERGLDTLEAADGYIAQQNYRETREGELLGALNIFGRQPTATERRHLAQWLEWGFGGEAVAVAYDITMTNLGRLNWNYCNAILRRWHEKGLHTAQEVRAEQKQERPAAPAGRSSGGKPAAAPPKDVESQRRENQRGIQEMKRLLEQMKQEE